MVKRLRMKMRARSNHRDGDILLREKCDRRVLNYVPDSSKKRSYADRRSSADMEKVEENMQTYIRNRQEGVRYETSFSVRITWRSKRYRRKYKTTCRAINISTTGMLLELKSDKIGKEFEESGALSLRFEIVKGAMPEGYEMKVHTTAKVVNVAHTSGGRILCGVEFDTSLSDYASKRKDRVSVVCACVLMVMVCLFIMLMRAESIIYFKYNKWLYLYSIMTAAFLLSRYLFGGLYKPVPINKDYTPGVTIIIPCFNEEEWIDRTIKSCINQDYPIDKLEILVVDDCSNDHSVQKIQETIKELCKEDKQFDVANRLHYVVQEHNAGKREALCKGAVLAKHDLVVFVDSDSFLDPFAIRNLVQPFQDPKMGGVSGRTDVANTFTNGLTKMQAVRYYISFRIMKAAEAYFDGVTCLSGPLACYRKKIIIDNMEAWLNQKFLGQKATFGDDRSMTNFVLKHHRTSYQDTAICSTIVPNKYQVFLKQQMRWKRSWLRESIVAGKFIWKKEPFMSLFFYMGVLVPIAAPVVVLYNLFYVPITQQVFPKTFVIGLLLMSFLMSAAQLLFRKSSTWLYGMFFGIYYEAVLLWQMPVAWFTFWKSTWGTRLTPEDIREQKKKGIYKEDSGNAVTALVPVAVLKLGRLADERIAAIMEGHIPEAVMEKKPVSINKPIAFRKEGKLHA